MSSSYFKKFRGVNGLLKTHIPVDNEFFTYGQKSSFLCWGIFNPMGPTINVIGMSGDDEKTSELIWFRNFNPFTQENWLLAQCDDEYEMATFDLLEKIIEQNGNENFSIYKSVPTFILDWSDYLGNGWPHLFWMIYINTQTNLKQINSHLRATKGKPWDRASLEMDSAFKSIKAEEESAFLPAEEDFEDWFSFIMEDDHIIPELANIKPAWEGAINFQRDKGSADLAGQALSFDKLTNDLELSGIDFFKKYIK